VCEPDFNSLAVSPPSTAWLRAWTAFCDAAVAGGWDPGYGARLMSDLEALELADLEGDTLARYVRGGSVFACAFADSMERVEERMLALGAGADDLAAAQGLLRDRAVLFHTPIVTTAWGRRPD
jgi:hypothetical protein